jgi:AAA+ superfamily predicted ATPase
MTLDRIESLRAALAASPENQVLRMVLADELLAAGRGSESLVEWAVVVRVGEAPSVRLVEIGTLALEHGQLTLAALCLEGARTRGVVDGVAALQEALDGERRERGVPRLVRVESTGGDDAEPPDSLEPEATITFADIGGLAEVKKIIHRMIILPFRRPDLYKKYGRRAGGGVMLYGPPGCGKTMLARATAGECELPFYNVRIEEILSRWLGDSERNLHAAFEKARSVAPCVLFLDEIDALAYARHKQEGGAGRSIVDQLLQELDAIGAENEGLLILAATNAPWDVDEALKRPGRFDRVVFVPPPDETARVEILRRLLVDRPVAGSPVDDLARATTLWSGADLRALVDRALDAVIDEAIEGSAEPPLERKHFDAGLKEMRPTTLDWLGRARNYVEFSNRTERYRDVEQFLKSKEVRRLGL